MKTFTTLATAAVLAAVTAAPVAAETQNDPFVSTQGSLGIPGANGVAVGLVAVAIIAAAASGDSTTVTAADGS